MYILKKPRDKNRENQNEPFSHAFSYNLGVIPMPISTCACCNAFIYVRCNLPLGNPQPGYPKYDILVERKTLGISWNNPTRFVKHTHNSAFWEQHRQWMIHYLEKYIVYCLVSLHHKVNVHKISNKTSLLWCDERFDSSQKCVVSAVPFYFYSTFLDIALSQYHSPRR